MLKFDKLRDSVCEDNSWIDGKFWQSFLSNVHKRLFYFFHVFYVLTFFKCYLDVYYICGISNLSDISAVIDKADPHVIYLNKNSLRDMATVYLAI